MSQLRHEMLPEETHDELARENFVQALKSHIATSTVVNRLIVTRSGKP
ncbi:MAG: hypothetical protein ACI8Y4_003045 [Candidatus Poriferisodalaceae bacterium]|jgi:hypothetical protein